MRALHQTHPIDLHWRSYELRPAGSPPIPPDYRARIEASRPRFAAMMWEQFAVKINAGPFGIVSKDALIADKYAESQGKGEAFHNAMFRAYWEEARGIDQHDVIREVAVSVGLDGDGVIAALEAPQYVQAVEADVMQAYQYGLSGVPAIVFSEKYLVMGAQPLEVLTQVWERARAEQSA